jgi:hypothetical protein
MCVNVCAHMHMRVANTNMHVGDGQSDGQHAGAVNGGCTCVSMYVHTCTCAYAQLHAYVMIMV